MTSVTTCPACNYTRKPSDDAPDWECPNCHKAYIKTARSLNHQEPEIPIESTYNVQPPVSAVKVSLFAAVTLFILLELPVSTVIVLLSVAVLFFIYRFLTSKFKYNRSAIPAILYFAISFASLINVYVARESMAGVGIAILTMPWSAIGVALIDSMHKVIPALNSMDFFDRLLRVGVAVVSIAINSSILLTLCGYFKKSE